MYEELPNVTPSSAIGTLFADRVIANLGWPVIPRNNAGNLVARPSPTNKEQRGRSMKTLGTAIAIFVTVVVLASASCAALFPATVLETPLGGTDYSYKITNNDASRVIVGWQLHWAVDDTADANLSGLNFVPATGYLAKPNNWWVLDTDTQPYLPAWIGNVDIFGNFTEFVPANGGFRTPFSVHYTGSIKPTLFSVYYSDYEGPSDKMNFDGSAGTVPEPGSILVLLSGLAATGLLRRRK
jgi:hypothetical protein